jgi:hypothetical protein
MYDILPVRGVLPITLLLENSTKNEQTVAIKGDSIGESKNSSRLSGRIAVAAGSTRTLSATVPLEENWSTSGGSLLISFNSVSSGLKRKKTVGGVVRPEDSCVIQLPVSKTRQLSLFSNSIVARFPSSAFLTERKGFMLQSVPDSWYQLIGVTEVWVTEEDISSLPSERKAALMDWVRSGGTLYTVISDRREENSYELGLGRVIGTSISPDTRSLNADRSEIKYGPPQVRSPAKESPLERIQSVEQPIRVLLFLYVLAVTILVGVTWYFNLRPAVMLFFVIPAIGLLTFTGGLALIMSQSLFGRSGTYETLHIRSDNGQALTWTAASVNSGIVLEEFLESRAPAVLYHGDTVLEGERNRAALDPIVNRITHLESRNVVIEEFLKTELVGELISDGVNLTSTYPGELRDLRWIDDHGDCHQYTRLRGSLPIAQGIACSNNLITTAFFNEISLRKGQFFATMEQSFQPRYDGIGWSLGTTYVAGSTREGAHE